jgi:hypothetical protein
MMKSCLGLVLGFLTFSSLASPLEIHRPWDDFSDPLIFNKNYNYVFSELPLNGQIRDQKKLWSGDYWPLYKGSINYRWYARIKTGFNLRSPSRGEAQNMSIPELAALSAAEKFDLFTGRYDYPLKKQVQKDSSPRAQRWEGICHGWAPASINHDEPRPKLLKNPHGLEIPFGSTDIKALLSYYYAKGPQTPDIHIGQRCYPETGHGCYKDNLNAGAFHIVLANKVGLKGKSFIIDMDRGGEVWNNPVYRYSSTVQRELQPSPDSAPGTVKIVRMRTDFHYVDGGDNNWRPVIGTPLQVIKNTRYEYDLDIDAYGKIIGGEWRSRSRPDFMWQKEKVLRFSGLMFRLGELLDE